MVVTASTTHPANVDGSRCGPLVIDPCLFLSFRANDLLQVKPNPAQRGGVAVMHSNLHRNWSNFDHLVRPRQFGGQGGQKSNTRAVFPPCPAACRSPAPRTDPILSQNHV